MASSSSFDIVSKIDFQEVDNAVNQALKAVQNRYDLKDSNSKIEVEEKEIKLESEDDYKVEAVFQILKEKMVNRGISSKALKQGKIEPSLGGRASCTIELQAGISKENAKIITKIVKDKGNKLQTQIQDDQVRVIGKKIDDLQTMIKTLKGEDFDFPLQFINFR